MLSTFHATWDQPFRRARELPLSPCRLEFFARTRLNPTIGDTSFEKGTIGEIRGGSGRRDGGLSVDRVVVVDGAVVVVALSADVEKSLTVRQRGNRGKLEVQ